MQVDLFFEKPRERDSESLPHGLVAVAVDDGIEGCVEEDQVELDVMNDWLDLFVPLFCLNKLIFSKIDFYFANNSFWMQFTDKCPQPV